MEASEKTENKSRERANEASLDGYFSFFCQIQIF
jgi:hypothetical protein